MSISATFVLVIEASKKASIQYLRLQKALCIQYPAKFNLQIVEVLTDLGSKVNAMRPSFVKQLDFQVR